MNSLSPQMLDLASGKVTFSAPGGGEGDGPGLTVRLGQFLRLIVRRRWILIGGVVAGAAVGGLITLVTPRQYVAIERLQIARETAQVVNVGSVSRDVSIGDQEFYQTQYGLLRAQALAERVARDLGVVDDPAFFRAFHRGDDFAGNPGVAGRAARNEIAGQILQKQVEVAPVHSSSLVDIQARAPSPELAQKMAQTWSQDFIASNLERRLGPALYAGKFLETRLEQLRDKLQSSERRAVEYAASQEIIELPTTGGSAKSSGGDPIQGRSLTSDDLSALNTARVTATADRIQASTKLAAAASQPGASGEALNYRAIGSLRQERAEAASEYARLAALYSPDDAGAKAAHAQVDALDSAIQGEENRVRVALQENYEAASAREKALTQRVNTLKASLTDLRRRSIQYNIYQRDADTNRELYDALLQRYKEIGVAGAVESNNVAVIDAATRPARPSSPRLIVNLVVATLAGAALGVLVAAVLDRIGRAAIVVPAP